MLFLGMCEDLESHDAADIIPDRVLRIQDLRYSNFRYHLFSYQSCVSYLDNFNSHRRGFIPGLSSFRIETDLSSTSYKLLNFQDDSKKSSYV